MDHSGPNKRGATNVTSPAGTVYDVIHTFDLPRNLQRLRQPYLNTVQLEFSDQFFPPQRPKSLPHSLVYTFSNEVNSPVSRQHVAATYVHTAEIVQVCVVMVGGMVRNAQNSG